MIFFTKPFLVSSLLSLIMHVAALVSVVFFFQQKENENSREISLDISLVSGDAVLAEGSSKIVSKSLTKERNVTKDIKNGSLIKVNSQKKLIEKIFKQNDRVFNTSKSHVKLIALVVDKEKAVKKKTMVDKEMLFSLPEDIPEEIKTSTEQNNSRPENKTFLYSRSKSLKQVASDKQSALLSLLHKQISLHQVYPYLAKRQGREGTAIVSFTLRPGGEINNINLIKSSKTVILDQAAFSAVENISPFSMAKEYLHQPENFQIDVVFKLL